MIGQVIQLRDGFGFISCNDINNNNNNNNLDSSENIYFRRNDIPVARLGDILLFDVNYGDKGPVASNLKMHEKKSDRMAKNLLELGTKKETGIIESIIKDFGFILTNNSNNNNNESEDGNVIENEKIYFRIEDVLNSVEHNGVRKGTYVEYLVIEEKSKGRMKKRAIAINIIQQQQQQQRHKSKPQIEQILAFQVKAMIVTQPRVFPTESPGYLRLNKPLDLNDFDGINPDNFDDNNGNNDSNSNNSNNNDSRMLYQVELWPRCMREDIMVKEGDEVIINIVYYHPDRLLFARKVIPINFCAFGREVGIVRNIVNNAGFGFLEPITNERDQHIYFRVDDLANLDRPHSVYKELEDNNDNDYSKYFAKNDINVGDVVSYDIIAADDPNSRGGTRYRGIRLWIEASNNTNTDNNDANTYIRNMSTSMLATGLKGIVNRNWRHNISALKTEGAYVCNRLDGVIPSTTNETIEELSDVRRTASNRPLVEAIEEFIRCGERKVVSIEFLTGSQRKNLHKVLNYYKSLEHESKVKSSNTMDGYASTIVFTIKKRINNDTTNTNDNDNNDDGIDNNNNNNNNNNKGSKSPSSPKSAWYNNIVIHRAHTNEAVGPILLNTVVQFDLYYDNDNGGYTARNVHLTLEKVTPVLDGYEFLKCNYINNIANNGQCLHVGIVDAVVGGKYGFIRRLPNDMKVFWHCSDCRNFDPTTVQEGSRVIFEIARKGGQICAINIFKIPFFALDEQTPEQQQENQLVLAGLIQAGFDLNKMDAHMSRLWVSHISEGHVIGVAISANEMIITDVSQCPSMRDKTWNLLEAIEKLKENKKSDPKNKDRNSGGGWSRSVTITTATESEKESNSDESNPTPIDLKSLESSPVINNGDTNEHKNSDDIINSSSSSSSSSSVHDDTSEFKYFTRLRSTPLPIMTQDHVKITDINCNNPNPNSSSRIQVGDIVRGRIFVNWTVSRYPLEVIYEGHTRNNNDNTSNTTSSSSDNTNSSSSSSAYYNGILNKSKITVDGVHGVELAELCIKTGGSSNSSSSTVERFVYCDARDISGSSNNSNNNNNNKDRNSKRIYPGAPIKFLMFGDSDLAVNVESTKGSNTSIDDLKGLEFDNILFRKDKSKSNGSGLAAVLAPSGLGNGANAMSASNQTITAVRPPSEDAVGFELGWRPVPNIKNLPWADQLLNHLQ